MAKAMLTTIDNPYNPFKHFDEWLAWDEWAARSEGRPTCCEYLARMTDYSDDLSDKEVEDLNELVIDDICELNLTGKFVKVFENEPEKEPKPA